MGKKNIFTNYILLQSRINSDCKDSITMKRSGRTVA